MKYLDGFFFEERTSAVATDSLFKLRLETAFAFPTWRLPYVTKKKNFLLLIMDEVVIL